MEKCILILSIYSFWTWLLWIHVPHCDRNEICTC